MQRPSQTSEQRAYTYIDGAIPSGSGIPKLRYDKNELCPGSGTQPFLVVVYSCNRQPAYLDYTLASLKIAAPAVQPVVSYDTLRAGPVHGFLQAAELAIKLIGSESSVNVLLLQDDAWVTEDAIRVASHVNIYTLLSLYRMTPHDKPISYHLSLGSRVSTIWSLHSQRNEYSPDLYMKMNDAYRSPRKRYNGGVAYCTGDQILRSCLDHWKRLASAHPHMPLPRLLGESLPHQYAQTLRNMVHHIGEISSVPGRPAGARMPVDDLPIYNILRKEWDAEHTESN